MRAPLSAIEPFRAGVSMGTRGDAASAASRDKPLGGVTPGAEGALVAPG